MDIPDRFTVDVTAEDIAAGVPTFFGCPLARALQRTYALDRWSATAGRVYHYETSMASIDVLDHDAAAFINAFDKGQSVSPCTVTLTRV